MKEKRLFLGVGIAALTIGAVTLSHFMVNGMGLITKAEPQNDYQQTLTFTASNMAGGSGSVTLNGNTFNYENVTYDGNNLVFGAGSSLVLSGESGETISANGMVGGSFRLFGFLSVGAANFTYTFNGVTGLVGEAANGAAFEKVVNSPSFNLTVTAGSFSTAAFNVKYDCVAPSSQRVLFIGEKDNYLNNSDYLASQAYTSLMDTLGQEVIVDELIETTTRPTYTMAVLAKTNTNFNKNLKNMLNENAYDAIVLQISPRCTPSSTGTSPNVTVEENEIAALASLKTILHEETDNIYIYAIQNADGNPFIWDNNDNLKYTQTTNKETKTFEEMCAYYSALSETMATAVEGKAMHFADCYSQYKSKNAGSLGYSVNYPSLRYMYAHVLYATFFNRMVPSASTYKGTNAEGAGPASDKAMAGVRTVVANNCLR